MHGRLNKLMAYYIFCCRAEPGAGTIGLFGDVALLNTNASHITNRTLFYGCHLATLGACSAGMVNSCACIYMNICFISGNPAEGPRPPGNPALLIACTF